MELTGYVIDNYVNLRLKTENMHLKALFFLETLKEILY